MKKIIKLGTSMILLGAFAPVVSAQTTEEFQALKDQVEALQIKVDELERLVSENNTGSTAASSATDAVAATNSEGAIVDPYFPVDLEEGYRYQIDDASFSGVLTLANLRYTKTHLAIDFKLLKNNFHNIELFTDLYRVFTFKQETSPLKIEINRIPTELITSDYPMVDIESIVRGKEEGTFTVYYKLNTPIEQSTTIKLEISGNETIDFELVEDPGLI